MRRNAGFLASGLADLLPSPATIEGKAALLHVAKVLIRLEDATERYLKSPVTRG